MRQLPPLDRLDEVLICDAEHGRLFWKRRPRTTFASNRAYSTFNARFAGEEAGSLDPRKGYWWVRLDGVAWVRHRLIWAMYHGAPPPLDREIDHRNRVKGDDRISNLRLVSPGENRRNGLMLSRNTSGVTGVYWNRERERWQAQIRADGRVMALGRYDTLEEAAAARHAAERLHNFSPEHGRPLSADDRI